LASAADGLYTVVKQFLDIHDESGQYAIGSGAYTVYNTFRNIANVLLAIAFLIIIFSEALGGDQGFGVLKNYDIKKTLPRLIIFAILINISWYLCLMAIDISNIVGASIDKMMESAATTQVCDGFGSTGSFSNMASSVIGGIEAGIGVAALALMGAGSMIFMVALLAVIALLMTFVILIIRQVAILFLAILSPVAFAMGILPNTQSLFKKWWSAFSKLLLVYPIVGVVYGGCRLASLVLTSKNPDGSCAGGWWEEVAAAAAQVLPLFLIPVIIKGSLKALGAAGAAIGNFANKRNQAAKGRVGNSWKTGRRNIANATKRFSGRHLANGKSRVGRTINGMLGFNERHQDLQKKRDSQGELDRLGRSIGRRDRFGHSTFEDQMELEAQKKAMTEAATEESGLAVAKKLSYENPGNKYYTSQVSQMKEQMTDRGVQDVMSHTIVDKTTGKVVRNIEHADLMNIIKNGGVFHDDSNPDLEVADFGGRATTFGNTAGYGGIDEITLRAINKRIANAGSEAEVEDAFLLNQNLGQLFTHYGVSSANPELADAFRDTAAASGEYLGQSPKRAFFENGSRIPKGGRGDGKVSIFAPDPTTGKMTLNLNQARKETAAESIAEGLNLEDLPGRQNGAQQRLAESLKLLSTDIAGGAAVIGKTNVANVKKQVSAYVGALVADSTKLSKQGSTDGGVDALNEMLKMIDPPGTARHYDVTLGKIVP